ncbi:MAG TPA: choice-of-anchor D domain-containing protein [Terriglobales bacterium]|nr:choice-of-anchor D domain-containing protein [Terriglobales bacterium]
MRRICSSLAIAILIAFLTVSCGGGGSASNNTSVKNAQNLVLDNPSLGFGNVNVGSSKSSTITLTNSSSAGGPSIGITAVTASGANYSVNTPVLPMTLNAGQSAAITVIFAPKSSGTTNGSLSIIVAGISQPVSVPLSGTGVVPGQLTVNPSSLDFGSLSTGSSKTDSVTLTNPSSGTSLTVTQIATSGTGYSVTAPTLPLTLTPGQSATASVTFAPKTSGTLNGTLTVTVSGGSQPVSVPLTGAGLASGQLSVNPSLMNFGNVDLGKSMQQSGSLTAGGSDVSVSSASWNGAGFSLGGITFPATIKAGTTASFTVTFAPQGTGSVTGQVSFVSNATNSPTAVTLSGAGVQHTVALAWGASTSQVTGYNIYRATTSGGPYSKLNSNLIVGLTFTDSSVQGGATYYYAATSVDSSNNESAYSNIATAVIP